MAPSNDNGRSNVSLLTTLALAFLLVNFILWGVAAAIYNGGSNLAGAPSVRAGRGILTFIISAVTTLPQIGSVIPYIWSHHKWYVAVFCVVEVLLILMMVWMKKVDQDLNRGSPFGKRKR